MTLSFPGNYPATPSLVEREYPVPAIVLTELSGPVKKQVGELYVEVRPNPLTILVTTIPGQPVQQLIFHDDNTVSFLLQDAPILGMGEGGHKPVSGVNWRTAPIEFDRRGRFQEMQPRWQSDAYGSRNPVPLLIGTEGWGLFVASPWVQVDLQQKEQGVLLPWKPTAKDSVPQNEKNQGLAQSKGLPPASSVIPGLYDLFIFDAHDPAAFLKDVAMLTGPSEILQRNVLVSEMNNPLIEPVVKKYDELRYQLLPYTYTLAWEARQTGMPLLRALWLHYPDDEKARGMGSEYLWGRDLLIAPVFEKEATSREVYLPKGDWYDWWTNTRHTGGQSVRREVDLSIMPIYVRAGAIIPFDPIRQYTSERVKEPTTLRIYPGADGVFTLYEDDGISLDYLRGKASWILMTWNDKDRTLRMQPGAPVGSKSQPVQKDFILRLMTEDGSGGLSTSGVRKMDDGRKANGFRKTSEARQASRFQKTNGPQQTKRERVVKYGGKEMVVKF